jgi:hypothetical protein
MEGRKIPVGTQKKLKQTKTFDALLLDAVDEGLSHLGEKPKASIYFHMEEYFGLKATDIPICLSEFSTFLEKLLGIGARHLEILFMKQLNVKLSHLPELTIKAEEQADLTFVGYVNLKRMQFEKSKKVQAE